MSYTAPQYVDTKEQAILALASTIKGEAVTGGDGSVNRALDILADVLAEQDVQVPQTDAGAILALADYVSGGGGGGSSDFTTATVTFTNNTSQMMVPFRAYITIPSITEFGITPEVRDSGEYTTALYKGCTFGGVVAPDISRIDVTTTGDATWDSDDSYLTITGDCTITIKEQGTN